ncbi:MAG: hypothetical protein ACOYK7_09140 [Pirellulales bacterium]|jgi:hypothetical protein
MDPNTIGQLGGWVGSAIGVAGALVGTFFSIRNTTTPRERAFVIRASVICWVAVIAFIVAMMSIPTWHKHLLWIPYAVLLTWGIRAWNRGQLQIRHGESGDAG